MVYIHAMEYYLAIKSEILTHATTWMNLENTLRETRHKGPYIAWFRLCEMSTTGKKSRQKVGGFGGNGKWLPRWASFSGDKDVLNLIVVIVVQLWEYTKNQWLAHFFKREIMLLRWNF